MKECISCGKNIKLGGFAYNQEVCWDCFAREVTVIANNTETYGEKVIILHLLDLAAEIHGTGRFSKNIKEPISVDFDKKEMDIAFNHDTNIIIGDITLVRAESNTIKLVMDIYSRN